MTIVGPQDRDTLERAWLPNRQLPHESRAFRVYDPPEDPVAALSLLYRKMQLAAAGGPQPPDSPPVMLHHAYFHSHFRRVQTGWQSPATQAICIPGAVETIPGPLNALQTIQQSTVRSAVAPLALAVHRTRLRLWVGGVQCFALAEDEPDLYQQYAVVP